MVESFGSREVFAGEYYHACSRSNAGDLYIAVTAKFIFFLFIEVFLIGSETKINKTKKIGFSEKLSPYLGNLLHLKSFSRQLVALSGD